LDKLATPTAPSDVMTIRRMIASVSDRFDVVLIDTPPNTNVATTLTGIVAADFVLSPVAADAFGTQSIISVQRAVAEAVRYQPDLKILGYVLNQLQHNGVNDAYVKMVRQLHGMQVLETEIPLAVAYREAMALRLPISHHKPKLKPAKLIAALVDEINERIEAPSTRKKVA
jgi:chromosome partitioning protein